MLVTDICRLCSSQVRQNPKEGNFFVQNLKRVAVVSYEDIERRIEEGMSLNKVVKVLLLTIVRYMHIPQITCSAGEIFKLGYQA